MMITIKPECACVARSLVYVVCMCVHACPCGITIFDVAFTKLGLGKGGLFSGPWSGMSRPTVFSWYISGHVGLHLAQYTIIKSGISYIPIFCHAVLSSVTIV
jgi:hypothetical protein